ncbi:hypothetical protein BZG36_03857 [Bifiguratus adelaidae]|uniref:Alginate lyase domain-containing protein n=1 Tax=Bifiguratus adelaidae TaxID=1938954 RepID=A0A261XWI1_9FUNG|nr:hypothetical protein BZG36_03857 [Bifiguratus adelaidae]
MKGLVTWISSALLLAVANYAMAQTTLGSLSANAQSLATLSLEWMDKDWDGSGFLKRETLDFPPGVHEVRQTAFYAVGLMLRNQGNDTARAVQAVNAILTQQYNVTGAVYDEGPTPTGTVEYSSYDPNWREFIGTTLILQLENWSGRYNATEIANIEAALQLAALGSYNRAATSIPPSYSNIAIMRAFMLDYVGRNYNNPTYVSYATSFAQQIYSLFSYNGDNTLYEYNSPTYTGVDFYGLSLWINYSQNRVLNNLGKQIINALWNDLAAFYHAGLKNIAGPYDRAYGIDMTQYIAIDAQWIWLAAGQQHAPLPDLNSTVWQTTVSGHPGDWGFAPLVAAVSPGASIPSNIVPLFQSFGSYCRELKRYIGPGNGTNPRVDTVWMSATQTIGGQKVNESTTRDPTQYYPAVVQWQIPGQVAIGHLTLTPTTGVITAVASEKRLSVSYPKPYGNGKDVFKFIVYANGAAVTQNKGVYTLPGQTFTISTAAGAPNITANANGSYNVVYTWPATNTAIPSLTLTLN